MTSLRKVPSLPELAAQGLAEVVGRDGKGRPTHYRPTPEGEQVLREAMAVNARAMLEDDTLSPHRGKLRRES